MEQVEANGLWAVRKAPSLSPVAYPRRKESSRVVTGGVRADLLEDSKVLSVFIC